MKKLIFTIVLTLPLTVFAEPVRDHDRDRHDDDAHKAAHVLVDAIQDLDREAFDAADKKSESHFERGIRELDAVSDAANLLERAIRRKVLREMHDPAGHDRFGRTLRELERRELRDLEYATEELNHGGFQIRLEIRAVQEAWRNFERALEHDHLGPGPGPGPGPGFGQITGNCVGKFGGNFFNKQSNVECTINGRGAESYTVQFVNAKTGQRATVTGKLDSRLETQRVVSDKVSVGTFADYIVTVTTRFGRQVEIGRGQCQGNPF